MKRHRWHVCKAGNQWRVHPLDAPVVNEITYWPIWEDALAYARMMSDVDLLEATA